MATIANQYDPNDPNKDQNAGGGGTVIPSTGGGDSGGSSGGGGTAPAGQTAPYSPPNVSQYLAANEGAGQQLSGAIQGNVQNQANQVNQSVSNTQNQLNSQYEPLNSKLSQGQQVAQTAFKDPQALLDSYNAAKTQSSNQPLASGQQAAQPNPQNLDTYNQFQQLNSGGYNQDISKYGNTATQGYNNLQGQVGNLGQQANAAANEMGRGQLLQQTVGQANYTPGQQTLDSLFLQGQGKQLQKNLGNIANQTGQNVANANIEAQSRLQALQGMSAADQAGIRNLFTTGQWTPSGASQGTGLNQIATNVGNEYQTAKNTGIATQDAMTAALASKQFTPEQIKMLGLTSGQSLWGLSGQDLANAGGYSVNKLAEGPEGMAAVASPEEFARYNALNQLAGGTGAPLLQGQQNIFAGANSAGGYNPISFNAGNAQAAIDARKNAITGADFQSQLSNAMNKVRQPSALPVYLSRGGVNPADQLQAEISQAQKAGNLTPEQTQAIFQKYLPGLQDNAANLRQGGGLSGYNSFQDWMQKTYNPAAQDILGSGTKKPIG